MMQRSSAAVDGQCYFPSEISVIASEAIAPELIRFPSLDLELLQNSALIERDEPLKRIVI
jgi:hypothetical protein